VLVAGVLLLAGCQARLVLDLDVTAEGDGELRVTLAADRELLDAAEAAGADPLGDLAATGSALAAEGWEVDETPGAAGGREVTLSAAFDDLAEFNELAATLAEALAAPEVRLIERLALSADADTLRLDGEVGADPRAPVAELGIDRAEAVALLEAHDAFRFEVLATLPGELLDTTAPGTEMPLRWEVPPGETVDIVAVVDRPSTPWWAVATAFALLLVVAGAWTLIARRRG
jgi:hypothetical protein